MRDDGKFLLYSVGWNRMNRIYRIKSFGLGILFILLILSGSGSAFPSMLGVEC